MAADFRDGRTIGAVRDNLSRGRIRETPNYKRGYVVLGGPGWTLRDYYVEKIQKHLVETEAVSVLSLEAFIALANEGRL
jgi:hypothetical protein